MKKKKIIKPIKKTNQTKKKREIIKHSKFNTKKAI